MTVGFVAYHDRKNFLIPPFFRYFCNTLYEVMGRNDAGDWLYLCCLAKEKLGGWVARENLILNGEIQQLEALTYPPHLAQVVVARLNVRSGPGLDYPIMTVINFGEVYQVVAQDISATWFKLHFLEGEEIGWVFAESLLTWGVPEQIPVDLDSY